MFKTVFVDRQAGRGDMSAHGCVGGNLIAVADGGGDDFGFKSEVGKGIQNLLHELGTVDTGGLLPSDKG